MEFWQFHLTLCPPPAAIRHVLLSAAVGHLHGHQDESTRGLQTYRCHGWSLLVWQAIPYFLPAGQVWQRAGSRRQHATQTRSLCDRRYTLCHINMRHFLCACDIGHNSCSCLSHEYLLTCMNTLTTHTHTHTQIGLSAFSSKVSNSLYHCTILLFFTTHYTLLDFVCQKLSCCCYQSFFGQYSAKLNQIKLSIQNNMYSVI